MFSDTLQRLSSEGWNLKPEALQALIADLEEDEASSAAPVTVSYTQLRASLLDADLRKLNSGGLPDDVNRINSGNVQGPLVLQVMSVADISRPSYATSASSRLLLLKLNDGRVTCKALEHKTCSQLTDTLLPGTKVVLNQASVKCGVLLLEPKGITILGGRVDSLAEAWETQKRYGGTNRQAAASAPSGLAPAAPGQAAAARLASGTAAESSSSALAADDGASAPKFKPFIPGRDGRRAPAPAPAAAAAAAAGSLGSGSSASAARGAGPSERVAVKPPQSAQQQQQQEEAASKRQVDVAPVQLMNAATAQQQSLAQAKLLGKLEQSAAAAAAGDRGRGRGRGRGRRRRYGDDDNDDGAPGSMTLEEYEARQSTRRGGAGPVGGAGGGGHDVEQMRKDEELARQLQAQLDLEEAGMYQQQQQQQQQQQVHNQRGGPPNAAGRGFPSGRERPPHYSGQAGGLRPDSRQGGVDYTSDMGFDFNYNQGRGAGSRGGHQSGGHRHAGQRGRGRGRGR